TDWHRLSNTGHVTNAQADKQTGFLWSEVSRDMGKPCGPMNSPSRITGEFAVLLGAGASVEAGLPTAADLTRRVLADPPDTDEERGKYCKLYRAIVGAI